MGREQGPREIVIGNRRGADAMVAIAALLAAQPEPDVLTLRPSAPMPELDIPWRQGPAKYRPRKSRQKTKRKQMAKASRKRNRR